jgi:hypothetical protein
MVRSLLQYIIHGSRKLGIDLRGVQTYKSAMEAIGFVDICAQLLPWPISNVAEDWYTIVRSIEWRLGHSSFLNEDMIMLAECDLAEEIPEVQM